MTRIWGLWVLALLVGCPSSGTIADDDTFADDDDDDTTAGDDDDTTPGDDDDTTAGDDDDFVEETCDARFDYLLDTFEVEMDVYGAPGYAIAVVESGAVTCAKGFGTRRPEEDLPARSTTLFRIGSMTKMLTAAALLQQVEAGSVDLEASINEYVPYFTFEFHPEWTEDMLVEHLLMQTSGMYDYIEMDGYYDDDDLAYFFDDVYGQYLFLMSPPGRFYNYSNPNFMLAGLIVEEAAGQYYDDYLAEHVLWPLGLERTFFDAEDVIADGDYATGLAYDWTGQSNDQVLAGPESYDNIWARPAGYAWSSVLDMAQFAIFLMDGDGDVLADEWREAMSTPQVDTEEFGGLSHYGYGLYIYEGFFMGNDFHDVPLVEHGGAIPGFSAQMFMMPDQELALVTLAATDGTYPSSTLAVALTDLMELPPPVPSPDLSVDPASYPDFVGTYRDEYNVGDIIVTTTDTELHVSMPLLDDLGYSYESVLYPYVPDNFVFYLDGYGMLVTFIRDDEGVPEYFRTRYFVGEAVAEMQAAAGLYGDPARADAILHQMRLTPDPRFH